MSRRGGADGSRRRGRPRRDVLAVGRAAAARRALLLAAALAAAPAGCAPEADPDRDAIRARAAAAFAAVRMDDAAEALAPLVERRDPDAEDLLRAAAVAVARGDGHAAEAHGWLDRAEAAGADPAPIAFLRGHLAKDALDDATAAEQYRRVQQTRPDDAPARILLAETLDQLGDVEGAAEQFRAVRARGVEAGGSFYATATYMLSRIYIRQSRADADKFAQGEALDAEHKLLDTQGIESADLAQLRRSGLGAVAPPSPPGLPGDPASGGRLPGFTARAAPTVAGATALAAADVDRDGRPDLLAWGPGLAAVAFARGDGWTVVAADGAPVWPVTALAAADLHESGPRAGGDTTRHDPALELLLASGEPAAAGGAAQILRWRPGAGAFRFEHVLGRVPYRAIAAIDFDHDGDLDIALADDEDVVVVRHDGVDAAGLPVLDAHVTVGPGVVARRLLVEDLDADQDVDLLAVDAEGGLHALSNLRGERFEDVSAAWGLGAPPAGAGPRDVALLDVDADGLPDLLLAGGDGVVWRRRAADVYEAPSPLLPLDGGADALAVADLDLDGWADLLVLAGDAVLAARGPLAGAPPPAAAEIGRLDGARGLAVADLDGDGDDDVALIGSGGRLAVLANAGPHGRSLRYELRGRKDNTHGVGAVLEARAGRAYRRVYWTGEAVLLGLGEREQPDFVMVTWPNGSVQYDPHIPTAGREAFLQPEELVGSCPFLYAWNGTTYGFVSDVLGATPLGLPMGRGALVPFDHEEYVKVRGEQLVPGEDGRLRLVMTEELREVTYLDLVRLHAIDHPVATEIEPDEGFVPPPFPPHHVHTLTDVAAPARAVAGDGRDVTSEVAAVDGVHAAVFRPLPWQYMGLAEPWSLELVLAETAGQRAALRAAPRVRLALTGWLLWTDASVNVAAAAHPDASFEMPSLQVPDGDGWRPAGPPIGFPAGKTKTQIVDVTSILDRDDPRLRLTSTLCLSWDAIRVVLDDDDAPFTDTPLPPVAARLAFRGFSRLARLPGFVDFATTPELGLEVFDWDELDAPRWNQHPGLYTRYGDVTPLLLEVDDQYAIVGAGDAVFLEFDGAGLPPLPAGWARDWLVHFDGWAKDRDPNTVAAERVEPLPFHAMSAYPPPPGEAFPTGARHEAWRRAWNTRPGRQLIVPAWARGPGPADDPPAGP